MTSLAPSMHAQISPQLSDRLQEILNSSVSDAQNNGVSAFVIWHDGTTWSGTAGQGMNDLPITENTIFHGASTTKFNIAVLLLLLAEDGLVDLDESWSKYVSLDASFDETITVRQLLNHTSGIADYLESEGAADDITSDLSHFYTPRYILEHVISDVPNFDKGLDFQYSNSNYVLAALIIEEVTGNPVHEELRNRIWNPLEMEHHLFWCL